MTSPYIDISEAPLDPPEDDYEDDIETTAGWFEDDTEYDLQEDK